MFSNLNLFFQHLDVADCCVGATVAVAVLNVFRNRIRPGQGSVRLSKLEFVCTAALILLTMCMEALYFSDVVSFSATKRILESALIVITIATIFRSLISTFD